MTRERMCYHVPMPSLFVSRMRDAWQRLDHGQQISLSILAPCAALTIILMVVSFRASVVMPFRAPKALLKQSERLLAEQRALAEQAQRQAANKDTDGDGLTDDDEARTFRTSPYLADSDSDTIPDGEEVRRGTDPNCPPERDCYGYTGTNPDGIPQTVATQPPTSTVNLGALEVPKPPNEITPPEIRAYLIRNRLAVPAQVDALTDEAVIELYGRAYGDLVAAQTPSAPPGAPMAIPTPASSTDPLSSPSQPSTP